ncbi:hypothetical protein MKX01_020153, partial [Papaver californicum]
MQRLIWNATRYPKLDQFPVDGFFQKSNFGMSSPQPPMPPAPSLNYVNSLDHVFSNGNPVMNNFDVYEYKPYLEGGGSTNNSSTNINNGSLFHQNKGIPSYPLLTSRETMVMDQNHQICLPSALSFQEPDLVNLGIPDELSCITADNGIYGEATVRKRNWPMKRQLVKGQRRSNVVNGKWTMEED